jgi:hypothetical protein
LQKEWLSARQLKQTAKDNIKLMINRLLVGAIIILLIPKNE